MKTLLRFVVSLAFSSIDEGQGTTLTRSTRRTPLSPEVLVGKSPLPVPVPVPADFLIRPIPEGDPLPFGAVTTVVSSNGITLGGETMVTEVVGNPSGDLTTEGTVSSTVSSDQETHRDNLALIRGLDPYSVTRLNDQGIVNFAQFAALTDKEVAGIEEAYDLPGCFNRFSWQYQAQQLMTEEE